MGAHRHVNRLVRRHVVQFHRHLKLVRRYLNDLGRTDDTAGLADELDVVQIEVRDNGCGMTLKQIREFYDRAAEARYGRGTLPVEERRQYVGLIENVIRRVEKLR